VGSITRTWGSPAPAADPTKSVPVLSHCLLVDGADGGVDDVFGDTDDGSIGGTEDLDAANGAIPRTDDGCVAIPINVATRHLLTALLSVRPKEGIISHCSCGRNLPKRQ
jgi:hypothetical protein